MPKIIILFCTMLIALSANAGLRDQDLEDWLNKQDQISCSIYKRDMNQVTKYVAKKFAPKHQGWSGCQPLHASGGVIGCEFSTGDGLYCYGTPSVANPGLARLDCYRHKPVRSMSESPNSYICGF